jgi:hypothetical protein
MFRSGRSRGDDPRNREYHTLRGEQRQLVDGVIDEARQAGQMARRLIGDTEYYAYPHGSGGTAWGINGGPRGFNIKRGVKP